MDVRLVGDRCIRCGVALAALVRPFAPSMRLEPELYASRAIACPDDCCAHCHVVDGADDAAHSCVKPTIAGFSSRHDQMTGLLNRGAFFEAYRR